MSGVVPEHSVQQPLHQVPRCGPRASFFPVDQRPSSRDLAALHLAAISTRMLSILSKRMQGAKVPPREVSNVSRHHHPLDARFPRTPLWSGGCGGISTWPALCFSVRRSTSPRSPLRWRRLSMRPDSRACWPWCEALAPHRPLGPPLSVKGACSARPGRSRHRCAVNSRAGARRKTQSITRTAEDGSSAASPSSRMIRLAPWSKALAMKTRLRSP